MDDDSENELPLHQTDDRDESDGSLNSDEDDTDGGELYHEHVKSQQGGGANSRRGARDSTVRGDADQEDDDGYVNGEEESDGNSVNLTDADDFGTFDVSYLYTLFNDIEQVAVMSTGDVYNEESWDNVPANATCLVQVHDTVEDFNVVDHYDVTNGDTGTEATWDLRMVFGTECAEENPEKWKGVLYARHGGMFERWWKYTRGQHGWEKLYEEYPVVELDCQCCVYVKTHHEELDKMRDQFLDCIGGQGKVYCGCHDLPMVASYEQRAICNMAGVCTKKTRLECPMDGCNIGICLDHYREVESDGNEDKVRIGGSESIDDDNDLHRGMLHRDESSDVDSDDDNMEFFQDGYQLDSEGGNDGELPSGNGIDTFVYDHSNEDDSNESDCGSIGGLFGREPVMRRDIELDGNELLRDTLLDYDESDDDERMDDEAAANEVPTGISGGMEIPTTNAGVDVMDVTMKDNSYIPLHAILNNCGSMLIRRNTKLEGTRRQQHFLHKIASLSPGQTVPLLYPEGMLFPSLFWKDDGDNSILGAFPTAFMTESSTLRQHGIASVEDQLRSRLTNASIMASTDDKYLL